MKAISIVVTLLVGLGTNSLCEGFRSWAPPAKPAALLSHRALHHSTQLFVATAQDTSLVNSSPIADNEKARLLEQAENYLGSSSLVYLYAELRQLSYCGYTKTKFLDIDCNAEAEPISGYKLLDILLKEREWLIKRVAFNADGEEWRSSRSLELVLKDLLDQKPPDCARGVRDLESLQEQIRRIGNRADEEEAADKLSGSIGKGSANRTPDDASSMIEKGARGALKKVLNSPTKDALATDAGDEKLIELITEFSKEFLAIDSERSYVFKEYLEMVYFGDRYTGKECVYCLTLYPKSKIVGVTFRGSVNLNDWIFNSQMIQKEVNNPAKTEGVENGQPDKIGLHYGFQDFLFRERLNKANKDGRPGTKFDRIIERVKPYTEEGWTLGVTGHSLGAALATLFSFYAATDQRVLQNGKPVEVFTFASPFVGDSQFRTAFKLLESEGKIVHARIVNQHDFVAMLPFISPKIDLEEKLSAESFADVNWYKHVGLQIFLAQEKENMPASVEYPFKEDVFAEAGRFWQSNIVASLPFVTAGATSHSLGEFQRRIGTAIRQETGANKLDADLVEYYARNIIAKVSDN